MRSGLVLNIEIRVAGQGGCDVVVYMIRRTRGHIRGALMDLDFYFFLASVALRREIEICSDSRL